MSPPWFKLSQFHLGHCFTPQWDKQWKDSSLKKDLVQREMPPLSGCQLSEGAECSRLKMWERRVFLWMFGSRNITKLLNFTATFEFIPLKRERCLKYSGPKQHWHGGQWGPLLWGLLRGLLSFLSSFIKFYQALSLIFTIRAIFCNSREMTVPGQPGRM